MNPAITPDNIAFLDGQIRQGTALLAQLETVLINERQALADHDFDTMMSCVEQKEPLLTEITQNLKTREQAFSAMGVASSQAGLDTLLAAIPPRASATLKEHWEALSTALKNVKAANEINHRIVGRGLENTNRLLSILQGQSVKNEVYGHSGNRNNLSPQSSLGKA